MGASSRTLQRLSVERSRRVVADSITEAQFQDQVIELARLHGWRVAHFRPARTAEGWRTPVAADGAGWPDLVLVREVVLFRELKRQGGRLGVAQQEWGARLAAAGADWAVWRPGDWDDIERALRGGS